MKSDFVGIKTDLISSAKQISSEQSEDFIAQSAISLKECYETEYWIEIAQKADLIADDIAKALLHDCGSIRRMLISSINTSKENSN